MEREWEDFEAFDRREELVNARFFTSISRTKGVIAANVVMFVGVLLMATHVPPGVGGLLIPVYLYGVPLGLVCVFLGILPCCRFSPEARKAGWESSRWILFCSSPLIGLALSSPLVGWFTAAETRAATDYLEACAAQIHHYKQDHGVYPASLEALADLPPAPRLIGDGGAEYSTTGDEFELYLITRHGWAKTTIRGPGVDPGSETK